MILDEKFQRKPYVILGMCYLRNNFTLSFDNKARSRQNILQYTIFEEFYLQLKFKDIISLICPAHYKVSHTQVKEIFC